MLDQETSRIFSGMFSGKQIHPFFSICKAGKRKREATEVDGDLSYVGRKDKEITSGPIHVFERTQVWFFWFSNVQSVYQYCVAITLAVLEI